MGIEVIQTALSAVPAGPYSQGIKAGDFVFVTGELGIDPSTGKIVDGGIQAETRMAMENIRGILAAVGGHLAQVVSTTVYLANMDDFGLMNEVYTAYFHKNPPGRTTVGVALPLGAAVKITATAYVGE